jgi:hypothetical protein
MGAQDVLQLSMRKDVCAEPLGPIALVSGPLQFVFGCSKTILSQAKRLVGTKHGQTTTPRRKHTGGL